MGTTNTTTGSNTSNLQFNPFAQNLYNSLIGGAGNVLGGYMNNPFGNPYYTMGAAQSQAGAQAAGANNMKALSQNALTSGLTGQSGAGFMAAQKAQTGRANQAMSSQANVQNVLSALQRQMSAAGTGLSFSPQLTGQSGNFTQQSTQGGLGTYAPALASLGLGAMTGGLGSLALGGLGALGSSALPGQSSSQLGGSLSNAGLFTSGMAGMGSGGLAGMLNTSTGYSPFTASMMSNVP
jgi:mucin-19